MNNYYNITRLYEDGRHRRIMRKGLTLKQAQDWCSDPDTSSMTAKNACNSNDKAIARWHDKQKHWFDAYELIK